MRKGANNYDGQVEVTKTPNETPEESLDMKVPEEPQVPEKVNIKY